MYSVVFWNLLPPSLVKKQLLYMLLHHFVFKNICIFFNPSSRCPLLNSPVPSKVWVCSLVKLKIKLIYFPLHGLKHKIFVNFIILEYICVL